MFVTSVLPTFTPGLSRHRCESLEELHAATPKRVVGEGAGGAGDGAAGHGGLGAGVGAVQ